MKIPTEKELLKAGVHFGHRPSSWHPKMSGFIYGQKNNVHIIDLEKTKKYLEKALNFIQEKMKEKTDSQVLFVGTRVQSKEIIKKNAENVKMPYVNNKWLGGTLTNFKVIHNLVKRLKKIEEQSKKEDYEKRYTKKERHEFTIEIERLNKMISGIRNMDQLPAVVFIDSARYEKTAVHEAKIKNIPTVAICDTNSNPEDIDYPIPANDDSIKSLELIIGLVTEAIKNGSSKISLVEPKKSETITKNSVE